MMLIDWPIPKIKINLLESCILSSQSNFL